MAYVPTTFVDRSVEFPNRRKLTAVPGQADTFDIARAEGTVFAEGTKPDAENLNAEFGKIKTETDSIITSLTAPTADMFIYDYQDGKYGYNTDPSRGADTFHPFSSGITAVDSLFGYTNTTLTNQISNTIPSDSAGNNRRKLSDYKYLYYGFGELANIYDSYGMTGYTGLIPMEEFINKSKTINISFSPYWFSMSYNSDTSAIVSCVLRDNRKVVVFGIK